MIQTVALRSAVPRSILAQAFAAGVSLLLVAAFLVTPVQAAAKPNLILVTLDSVRTDRVGFLGSKSNVTPNLNRLAVQSFVFERAYAQAPARSSRMPPFLPDRIRKALASARSAARFHLPYPACRTCSRPKGTAPPRLSV